MNDNPADESPQSDVSPSANHGFTAHLVRLVRAVGETLSSHAPEIVGRKSGTTAFDIIIHFPMLNGTNDDPTPLVELADMESPPGGVIPIIETRQRYLSDEALKVIYHDE